MPALLSGRDYSPDRSAYSSPGRGVIAGRGGDSRTVVAKPRRGKRGTEGGGRRHGGGSRQKEFVVASGTPGEYSILQVHPHEHVQDDQAQSKPTGFD